MPLQAEIRVKFTAEQTGSHDAGTPKLDALIQKALTFAQGTGASQADLFWSDERTLAASATEDIDLAGVLTDVFGATVTMAEVVMILVVAADGNTNDVVLGDATAPIPLFGGTNPTHAVKPGGIFLAAAPGAAGLLTVGAGATDDLKVTNSAGTTPVTYEIAVLGRSV